MSHHFVTVDSSRCERDEIRRCQRRGCRLGEPRTTRRAARPAAARSGQTPARARSTREDDDDDQPPHQPYLCGLRHGVVGGVAHRHSRGHSAVRSPTTPVTTRAHHPPARAPRCAYAWALVCGPLAQPPRCGRSAVCEATKARCREVERGFRRRRPAGALQRENLEKQGSRKGAFLAPSIIADRSTASGAGLHPQHSNFVSAQWWI